MLYISDARIDQLIAEDMPYIDLTTEVLEIGGKTGRIEFFTREACVLCGTEEVARICAQVGARVESMLPSGTNLELGQVFLTAEGTVASLHAAWKVCLNVLDHTSAIATKARTMVDAAHAANPACEVLTTRKSMPGCKDLVTKAVMTGGAFPHRLGLSETVLVFGNHLAFMGGFDAFVERLPELRSRCIEKKLFVEADANQARVLARAGVDGIQLDKLSVEELGELVPELRAIDPRVTLVAAGGINPGNAAAHAATGVDGLATTALFTAKPIDMSARMLEE